MIATQSIRSKPWMSADTFELIGALAMETVCKMPEGTLTIPRVPHIEFLKCPCVLLIVAALAFQASLERLLAAPSADPSRVALNYRMLIALASTGDSARLLAIFNELMRTALSFPDVVSRMPVIERQWLVSRAWYGRTRFVILHPHREQSLVVAGTLES